MAEMPLSKEQEKEIDAETRAFVDMADRVSRNDPDWGLYREGEARPRLPWWRRLLKL
jgi:hypothetical protein